MLLGLGLMTFPYVVTDPFWMFAVGAALSAAAWTAA